MPLILGGADSSDMAKRVRLLEQVNHLASNEETLALADGYLRGLSEDQWVNGPEPPSNIDAWGKEDVPPLYYKDLVQ